MRRGKILFSLPLTLTNPHTHTDKESEREKKRVFKHQGIRSFLLSKMAENAEDIAHIIQQQQPQQN